ncbi:MAG: hypothetical protein H7318_09180 [Oligoflexus sp.]|nr:hypothetical protein [Oligoflexus sp.]
MKYSNILVHIGIVLSFLVSVSACGSKSDSKDNPALPPASGRDNSEEQLKVSKNGLFNVEVTWSPSLEAGTLNNSALIHFRAPASEHAPAILKSFRLYHSTMGHGSIKENEMTFTEEEAGHWLVKNIYFSMPGAASSWVVDIEAELNGVTDSVRVVIDAEVR